MKHYLKYFKMMKYMEMMMMKMRIQITVRLGKGMKGEEEGDLNFGMELDQL